MLGGKKARAQPIPSAVGLIERGEKKWNCGGVRGTDSFLAFGCARRRSVVNEGGKECKKCEGGKKKRLGALIFGV